MRYHPHEYEQRSKHLARVAEHSYCAPIRTNQAADITRAIIEIGTEFARVTPINSDGDTVDVEFSIDQSNWDARRVGLTIQPD
jgi:hypothetical protein